MTRTRTLRYAAPILVAATMAAACSSSNSSSSSQGSSTGTPASAAPTTTVVKVSGTLNGSGSSFQKAFEDEAIAGFTKVQSGATINYQSKGSGAGQTDLQGGQTDFAGSDVPAKDADLSKFKGDLLYFPIISGPITVSYKLSGVTSLQLSATSLAKIFSRSVKTWDDPAIAADNPGAKLPSTPITVVHRSDASGTTSNFTAFLKAADPADWTLGSSTTVPWPTDTQAGNGNAGVAQAVKGTDGAIGYVDFSDAKAAGLTFAKVKNASGKYVEATLESAAGAVANAKVKDNLFYDPINAAGDTSYPITSPTFIITYTKYPDQAKVTLLKAYLAYVLGKDGQATAKKVDFAPLPAEFAQKAIAQLDKITVG
ncbi:MAG: phosphate ABC transporter substrate-binding protein PstS [Acidimicrobiales bacterium]